MLDFQMSKSTQQKSQEDTRAFGRSRSVYNHPHNLQICKYVSRKVWTGIAILSGDISEPRHCTPGILLTANDITGFNPSTTARRGNDFETHVPIATYHCKCVPILCKKGNSETFSSLWRNPRQIKEPHWRSAFRPSIKRNAFNMPRISHELPCDKVIRPR